MYLEKLDGTRKTIDGKTADKLRVAYSERKTNKLTPEQLAYLQTLKQIVYGPDQHFCFCYFKLTKTVPMRTNNLYILACENCKQTITTDIQPNI